MKCGIGGHELEGQAGRHHVHVRGSQVQRERRCGVLRHALRRWRILRIMHSVTEVLELQHEEHLEEHHKQLEQMQQVGGAESEWRGLWGRKGRPNPTIKCYTKGM